MKIVMRVVEGPDAGREFVFPAEGESGDEGTNILVGRDDVECQAHWRLSKEDTTVSRAHLLLEIRPPNCQVQDNGSLNGVYLRRGNELERRVVNELLQNGDCLRLGRTVVKFEISAGPVKTVYVEAHPSTYEHASNRSLN
jgi:pSer/pThr/pTyr-binding forkhead associated (FHA) protein